MPDCCSTGSCNGSVMANPAAETTGRCPCCGRKGRAVGLQTLKHHVKPEHLAAVEIGKFNFCPTASCDVVYFNEHGTTLAKSDVRERIGLKESDDPVPLCYCFGFTKAMVEDEVRATGRCTILQRIRAELKAGTCACEIRNPQGSCCLGNVAALIARNLISSFIAKDVPAASQNAVQKPSGFRRGLAVPRNIRA